DMGEELVGRGGGRCSRLRIEIEDGIDDSACPGLRIGDHILDAAGAFLIEALHDGSALRGWGRHAERSSYGDRGVLSEWNSLARFPGSRPIHSPGGIFPPKLMLSQRADTRQ